MYEEEHNEVTFCHQTGHKTSETDMNYMQLKDQRVKILQ